MPANASHRSASPTPSASVPRYAQIKQFLKMELSSGRWPAGTLMPSEADLVAQFAVSRMTVNRALRELTAEGLVERVQGVGTFAAQLQRVSSTLTLRNLHDEIMQRGHRHQADVKVLRQERAAAGLAQQLNLTSGAPVFHSIIVHHEDGVPLQVEDRYVNPACAPDYLGCDFRVQTPTQYLLEVAPLWEAQYTVQAAQPGVRQAKWLGIAATDPCLIVVRRTSSQGIPITLVRLTHPGSRYQIDGRFTP